MVTIIGIVVSSGFTYYEGVTIGFTQNYVQLFDYVTAISVFIVIKKIFLCKIHLEGKTFWSNFITMVGSLTFGMYLLDPVLRKLAYDKMVDFLEPILPTIFVSIAWCVLSMFIGGMITFILKKIPVFKKIL